MKGGKSPGLDGILNELIVCLADKYPHLFKNLFNKLLDIGIFPSAWINSVIIPLHKKCCKSDEKNYSGIVQLYGGPSVPHDILSKFPFARL